MVKFSPAATEADRAAAAAAVGGTVASRYSLVPGLVHLEITCTVGKAIAVLSNMKGVEYAEPDFVVRADAIPNDPYFR